MLTNTPELSPDANCRGAEGSEPAPPEIEMEPGMNGEKAAKIHYKFKLEYDKNLGIVNFKATR